MTDKTNLEKLKRIEHTLEKDVIGKTCQAILEDIEEWEDIETKTNNLWKKGQTEVIEAIEELIKKGVKDGNA